MAPDTIRERLQPPPHDARREEWDALMEWEDEMLAFANAVARKADLFKDALTAIAEGREPCTECGKPHEFKKGVAPNWGSWAAEDGHYYRRATPFHVASQALASEDGA